MTETQHRNEEKQNKPSEQQGSAGRQRQKVEAS